MEKPSLRFMVMGIFAVIGVVLFFGQVGMVVGQECGGDVAGIILECAAYVQKGTPMTDPSQACCDVIKKVDIPCACKHVTKEVEQMVDMNKVVHVVTYCGTPVPAGTKCGSFTVPGGGR